MSFLKQWQPCKRFTTQLVNFFFRAPLQNLVMNRKWRSACGHDVLHLTQQLCDVFGWTGHTWVSNTTMIDLLQRPVGSMWSNPPAVCGQASEQHRGGCGSLCLWREWMVMIFCFDFNHPIHQTTTNPGKKKAQKVSCNGREYFLFLKCVLFYVHGP